MMMQDGVGVGRCRMVWDGVGWCGLCRIVEDMMVYDAV